MAWPVDVMWANDRSLSEFQIQAARPQGFLSAPGQNDRLQVIPGRTGALRVTGEGDVPPRRFTVPCVIRTDTKAATETAWNAAKRFLSQDTLEVWFADWPDRLGYARYIGATWGGVSTTGAEVVLTFEMADPLTYSRQTDVYVVTDGADVPLVLGSAPSDVWVQVIGTGMASPQFLYRDAQGFARGDISFGLTLLVGQWINWNWDGNQQARLTTDEGTIEHDVPELIPTLVFVADPDDGDLTTGPTISAVNCDLVCRVRQSWL